MDEETERELRKLLNQSKDFRPQEVIILVIITCIFSFFAGTAFARMKDNPLQLKKTPQMSEELENFVENYQNIVDNYYEDVDEETLLKAALKGIMEELDPYSIYMDEDAYNNLNLNLEGSYSGIGIAISKDLKTGYMIVQSVFAGSAADEAGIKPGDILISVDGKKTSDMETSDFSKSVLQSTNKNFELVVKRGEEEFTANVIKKEVEIPSVESKVFQKNDKKIGYLYVSIFAKNTDVQFKEQLENLEKEKIDSLIIDVRDNTGGYLPTVTNMIALFVDSSHVAYQFEQDGKKEKIYSTGKETKEYPIVFLANRNSASASEVLIGCLKENLNAKIVGEKTYGKGTVQQLETLKNGDQYKITTKKWLTPEGNWVNDTKGFEPDESIALSEEYYENPSDDTDNQLQRAIEVLSN